MRFWQQSAAIQVGKIGRNRRDDGIWQVRAVATHAHRLHNVTLVPRIGRATGRRSSTGALLSRAMYEYVIIPRLRIAIRHFVETFKRFCESVAVHVVIVNQCQASPAVRRFDIFVQPWARKYFMRLWNWKSINKTVWNRTKISKNKKYYYNLKNCTFSYEKPWKKSMKKPYLLLYYSILFQNKRWWFNSMQWLRYVM